MIVYGYPQGGSDLAITKGIVSRIEFGTYWYDDGITPDEREVKAHDAAQFGLGDGLGSLVRRVGEVESRPGKTGPAAGRDVAGC